ncbi:MAG TPA: histidinol-phosphate transaminase [Rhodanobacteraceae bacterium]|jgi:histidinol-phosphate aminotransferase|nr:histidinol-phosphate transaminase [Rhodanobacteraceae bacterium]
MSDVRDLLRSDLRDFAGYRSARAEEFVGDVWLNANESPWPSGADGSTACRRYPEPQPSRLVDALAALYDCMPEQILIGRGSDEAIDLVVRASCVPGHDAIVVTPPVFGMYAIAARLAGVRALEVPLLDGTRDFEVDFDCLATTALAKRAKVVFLCSPGNPAGSAIASERIAALASVLENRALVVVDEAYVEFADVGSLAPLIARRANLVILRTLSKAHALAGARIGCAIADPALISAFRRCQAPYPVPTPSASVALDALRPAAIEATRRRIDLVRSERDRVAAALAALPGIRRIYPSSANFVLARFSEAEHAYARLLADRIVVRDMRALPQLDDALRITIGTPAENDRLLAALAGKALAA